MRRSRDVPYAAIVNRPAQQGMSSFHIIWRGFLCPILYETARIESPIRRLNPKTFVPLNSRTFFEVFPLLLDQQRLLLRSIVAFPAMNTRETAPDRLFSCRRHFVGSG